MNVLQAFILSVIEGVTEFLPVSSTGHLILSAKILGVPATEFVKSFEIFIQLGAIMAVATLYGKRIIRQPALIRPILIAFIPTGIIGLLFYKLIKTYLLGNSWVVILSLAGVGVVMILLERYWKSHPPETDTTITGLTLPRLISIGLFQSVSMIPGISRSAASIIGGMMNGLSRTDAVEFSFLLAVPTMAAATGLDLLKNAHSFTAPEIQLLGIGFVGSWITALAVMNAFLRYMKSGSFTYFGIYRIAAALLYLFAYL